MSSRTSHKKSRNGCLHCKRLRVKCDETKPSCLYCVRNDRVCEYVNTDLWMPLAKRRRVRRELSTKPVNTEVDVEVDNLSELPSLISSAADAGPSTTTTATTETEGSSLFPPINVSDHAVCVCLSPSACTCDFVRALTSKGESKGLSATDSGFSSGIHSLMPVYTPPDSLASSSSSSSSGSSLSSCTPSSLSSSSTSPGAEVDDELRTSDYNKGEGLESSAVASSSQSVSAMSYMVDRYMTMSQFPNLSQRDIQALDFFWYRGSVTCALGDLDRANVLRSIGIQVASQSEGVLSAMLAFSHSLLDINNADMVKGLGDYGTQWLCKAIRQQRAKIASHLLDKEALPELLLTSELLSATSFLDPLLPLISFSGGADIIGLAQGEGVICTAHMDHIQSSQLRVFVEGHVDPKPLIVGEGAPDLKFILYLWEVFNEMRNEGRFSSREIELYSRALTDLAEVYDTAFKKVTYLPILVSILSTTDQFILEVRQARPFAMLIMLFLSATIRGPLFSARPRLYHKWEVNMNQAYSRLPKYLRPAGQIAWKYARREVFVDDWAALKDLSLRTLRKMMDDSRDHSKRMQEVLAQMARSPETPLMITPDEDRIFDSELAEGVEKQFETIERILPVSD